MGYTLKDTMTPIQAKQASLEDIKKHLRVAFVMEVYGHTAEYQDTDGKLHYLSPFRDEENPSLDVFSQTIKGRTEPEERYGDFAEGSNGDVIDLVGRFEAGTRADAIEKSRDLLVQQIEDGWTGPTVTLTERVPMDLAEVEELVHNRRSVYDGGLWFDLGRTHPGLLDVELPPDRVFLHPHLDKIVFLVRDRNGEVVGARFRERDRKSALKGSRNALLRLADPSQKPVFLCEGETDTWAAWSVLKDKYEVLGVPGVGNHPEKLAGDELDGRVVIIAFDADDAGREGHARWADFLLRRGCTVKTVVLAPGRDLASYHKETIARMPSRARVVTSSPANIVRHDGGFGVLSKNGNVEALSNWSFEPTSVLLGEGDDYAYRGILLPQADEVVLPVSAFSSARAMKKWSNKHKCAWYSTDTRAQEVLALIQHEAALVPEGRYTSQVGLFEGSFVWHNGYLGDTAVEYLPPKSSIGVDDSKIFLKPGGVDADTVFWALYRSQASEVTGPFLAWLAAAPLRTRFKEFPILNVAGVSGSGKTALVKEFLRVFTSSELAPTLTSTTPYAVTSTIDSSNGFPVWFDEYRPGAKQGAKIQLDQLLRDAYTGQDSMKGGMQSDNLNALSKIRTTAPLIISGEDSFSETSHMERMVQLRLTRSKQGDLNLLNDIATDGFAFEYLSYLTRKPLGAFDTVAPVFETPMLQRTGYEDELSPRDNMNLKVLQFGWSLLRGFLDGEMPELDLSLVLQANRDAASTNPIMEIIEVCYINGTHNPTVWADDKYLYVYSANLMSEWESRHRTIQLPVSSAKGITQYLADQYGATTVRKTPPPHLFMEAERKQIRTCRVLLSRVDWWDHENHPAI